MTIDGGTISGYALTKPGLVKPMIGFFRLPPTDRIGRFCRSMSEILVPFARLHGVTEFGIEAPIIVSHKDQHAEPCPKCGKVDRSLNAKEVDKLFGIVHAVEMAADELGIACERIARGTVCLHVAGTGRGTSKQLKTYCLLACQRKGWNINYQSIPEAAEDVADAACTLDYYTWKHRIPVGWNNQPAPGPMFEQQAGVRIEPSNKKAAARVLNSALSFERERHGT